MAKTRKLRLTDAICRSATCPPGAGRVTLADAKMAGLILRATENGAKSFYSYRWTNGQPVRVKLGDVGAITLDQARDLANGINIKIASGIDPRAERQEAKAELTLGELFNRWLETYAKLHRRSWRDDQARYNTTLARWNNRRLSSIRRADAAALHARLGTKRIETIPAVTGPDGQELKPARKVESGGPYTANRTLELLRVLFNYARQDGFKGDNPAVGVKSFREESRERFLAADELPRFFEALDGMVKDAEKELASARAAKHNGKTRAATRLLAERTDFRDFVILALLTGARRRNVGAMTWLDVNLDRAIWRIPSTKSGDPVTVTISAEAFDILQRRRNGASTQWVFPSSRSASGHYEEPRKAWRTLLHKAGLSDLHLHDLRRTLGSWQAAGGSSLAIIGKSLGHRAGSQATAVYARLELDPVRQSVEKATSAMMQFRKKA